MKQKEERSAKVLIFLCWLAYAAAYVGRLNLNAYIEPIRTELGATKTELGLVSSFFFFSYGAGQLIHGILSKRYNTRYSVLVALLGSAAVNISMAFCTSAAVMRWVWLFNGVFQSILWSSVIKTLSETLPQAMLGRAIVAMSTPPMFGTFLVYGAAALLSSLGVSFRWMFLVPAALLIVIGIIWFAGLGIVARTPFACEEEATPLPFEAQSKKTSAFLLSGFLLLLAAISNGFIKDGVTTWTPSILKETYGMRESLSIFVTVCLPLLAMFGSLVSTYLYKRLRDYSSLNGLLFSAETVVLLLVLFAARAAGAKTGGILASPVLLLILFAFSSMLMSAANNTITSIVPMYLRARMHSGLLAGVLDTFCYVGSTLSIALLGYLADHASWNGVFLCLLLFAFSACAVCWFGFWFGKKKPSAWQT